MRFDPIAVIDQMREAVSEMNAIRRDGICQCAMQVAAMQRVVGCVESRFDGFPHGERSK